LERLLDLLRLHEVNAIADVRSQPYSRFNPQFNRESLSAALKRNGLEYVFLGHELGARSEDPSCYRDGRAQYALIAQTAVFARGVARLLDGMGKFRLAILCAEKEPLDCHRTLLIGRHLYDNGVRVRHILEDGRIEEHEALQERMLAIHNLQDSHLFHSKEERIVMAYEKQAEQIQYSAAESAQESA
jgi:uncharacterized protein (DUF488 family)